MIIRDPAGHMSDFSPPFFSCETTSDSSGFLPERLFMDNN